MSSLCLLNKISELVQQFEKYLQYSSKLTEKWLASICKIRILSFKKHFLFVYMFCKTLLQPYFETGLYATLAKNYLFVYLTIVKELKYMLYFAIPQSVTENILFSVFATSEKLWFIHIAYFCRTNSGQNFPVRKALKAIRTEFSFVDIFQCLLNFFKQLKTQI